MSDSTCGHLHLDFSWTGATTVLARAHHRAPLQVQRPFYPDGPATCQAMMLHNAGGMVAGDRLVIDVTAREGTHARLVTASAGKIYRSTGPESRQEIHLSLHHGAVLEWRPQETIVFDGARYRQELHVALAPGARWLGAEVVRFGRTASGERFWSGEWRSHTEVWQGHEPLWIDRQLLPAGREAIDGMHGLAGRPVVGSLVFLGHPVPATVIAELRADWDATVRLGEAGVTALPLGLVCRYRGPSSTEAHEWFAKVGSLVLDLPRQSLVC